MSRKLILAAVAALLGTIGLTACGGGGAPPLKVSLEAQDIKWSSNAITASVGQSVEVTVVNTGALEHNFSVDQFTVNKNVAIGATETITFAPSSSGTYEFYCAIAGHREAGMVGTLTVNP